MRLLYRNNYMTILLKKKFATISMNYDFSTVKANVYYLKLFYRNRQIMAYSVRRTVQSM